MTEKSCTDCKYHQAYKLGGDYYDPPTFEWECENESETTDFIESYGLAAASHCPLYEVRMIESCPSCGAPINQSYLGWKIWCNAWDNPIPVCSQKCVEEEDRKAQDYYQEILQKDPDFDSSQSNQYANKD